MAVLLVGVLFLGALSSDGAPPLTPGTFGGLNAVEDVPSEPVYEDPVWEMLAGCESTHRWWINSGNGYFGGLQMDLMFWRRHGGLQYAARPDLASREEQIAVAIVGQSIQGWRAWPVCSRVIGVR